MAIKKKPQSRSRQLRDKVCTICKDKKELSWQNSEELKAYLSPRGRILGREISGVCVKHQRHLAESIKQARHLGLLPFSTLEA